MNWIAALFIGLFVGWIIEWVIDWLYWRHWAENIAQQSFEELKLGNPSSTPIPAPPEINISRDENRDQRVAQIISELQAQIKERDALNEKYLNAIAKLQTQLNLQTDVNKSCENTVADLRLQIDENEIFKSRSLVTIAGLQNQLKEIREKKSRSLQDIKGIGPVIKGKLNAVGIYTFSDLSEITADDLEEIVGKRIRNLVDEHNLIEQAKNFSQDNPEPTNDKPNV